MVLAWPESRVGSKKPKSWKCPLSLSPRTSITWGPHCHSSPPQLEDGPARTRHKDSGGMKPMPSLLSVLEVLWARNNLVTMEAPSLHHHRITDLAPSCIRHHSGSGGEQVKQTQVDKISTQKIVQQRLEAMCGCPCPEHFPWGRLSSHHTHTSSSDGRLL